MKPFNFIKSQLRNCFSAIVFLLYGLLPFVIFAQSPKITFKQISIQQGLSNSWVEAICQDYRGFMWFGTRDGLNRYEGQQIRVYKNNEKDTNSISDNFIRYIYEDRQHNLWIGTSNGLNLFKAASNTFVRYKHNPSDNKTISNNTISCIYEDSKENLWVSTLGGGLNLFNRKENTFYHFRNQPQNKNSISDDIVNYIYEDAKGNIWVATEKGLNLYNINTKSFVAYTNHLDIDNSNSCNEIKNICGDKNGNLFLGTQNAGIIIFNPEKNTFSQLNHIQQNNASLSGNFVYSTLADHNGRIWVGTVNEGLNLYNSGDNTFSHFRHEASNAASLAQRTASAIFEDKQQNLWVGTHRGGVCLYAPGADKFRTYRQEADPSSLSYSDVKTLCEDKKGNIWIGTDGGGLNLFNRKENTFKHYVYEPNNPNSLNSDAILDITEGSNGSLWISTWGGGLNLFNPGNSTFRHYKNIPGDKTSISSNFVQKTFEDSEGNLWIGTYYGGLNMFNVKTNSFTRITNDPAGVTSFSGNNVVAINEDKKKNIWIGTDDGGLNCYNLEAKRFTHYFNNEEKKPDCRVIFVDSKGRVWIGQLGLYLLNTAHNRFELLTGGAGFPGEFIKGITEDEEGNLWVSSSTGLAKFNPNTLAIKKFNTADGLQGSEYESNAFLKARDGEMFFGGNTGLNVFYPKDIKTNGYIPPVYITGFQILNKNILPGTKDSPLATDVAFAKSITLSHLQSFISFDFAALNYVTAENNQYAYQLEGIDKDWVYAGNETKASYTNLSPGTYTFHVKASNNDGIWNETGASVTITITPPFWLTWWFKTLCVIAIAGSIYAYYYSRMKNIRRQKIELERQVKERTTEVMLKAEELQEVNEELKAQSEELTRQAVRLKEMNEQLEAQKEQEMEKAIAQNKFEIASEVLHDVGNAIVGFGAHVNRISRSLDQNHLDKLQSLVAFLKLQQPAIAGAIGNDKAGALTVIAEGIAKSQHATKDDIRKSVGELFNIISHIEQILNIQRQYVRSQAHSANRKPVDLTNVINDCRAMVSASIDKRDIALKVNIAPGAYILKGDHTKLMQVILNVLKNSVEAISPDATEKRINVCLKNTGSTIEIKLTDSGLGFDAITGSRLFERGFTTKDSGTGLGLYNCKSIIESHNGSFELKSEGRGLGSTAVIKFFDQNNNQLHSA